MSNNTSAGGADEGFISYHVLYDFVGDGENELGIREGEVVTGPSDEHGEWLWATNSLGDTGYVPRNFVEPTTTNDVDPSSRTTTRGDEVVGRPLSSLHQGAQEEGEAQEGVALATDDDFVIVDAARLGTGAATTGNGTVISPLQHQQDQNGLIRCVNYVELPDGSIIDLPLEASDSILSIKLRVQEKRGIPVERQILIFAGKSLSDKALVGDYDVPGGATFKLVEAAPQIVAEAQAATANAGAGASSGGGGGGGGGVAAGGGPLVDGSTTPGGAQRMPAASESDEPPVPQMTILQKVAQEIIETEKGYVESLELLTQGYFEPLSKRVGTEQEVLTEEQCKMLFGGVKQIWQLNQNLLGKLMQEGVDGDLGAVFLQFAPFMQLYKEYLDHADVAMHELNTILQHPQQGPRLQAFCANLPQQLDSLLIKPVQRLPRYRLLLKELLKQMDKAAAKAGGKMDATTAKHRRNTDLALKKIEAIAHKTNKSIADKHAVAESLALFKKWEGMLPDQNALHRRLLMEGQIDFVTVDEDGKIKWKTKHLMLFNDCVAYYHDSGVMMRLRGPRIRHLLTMPVEVASVPAHFPNKATSFAIVSEEEEVNPCDGQLVRKLGKGGATWYIKTRDLAARMKWYTALQQASDAYKAEDHPPLEFKTLRPELRDLPKLGEPDLPNGLPCGWVALVPSDGSAPEVVYLVMYQQQVANRLTFGLHCFADDDCETRVRLDLDTALQIKASFDVGYVDAASFELRSRRRRPGGAGNTETYMHVIMTFRCPTPSGREIWVRQLAKAVQHEVVLWKQAQAAKAAKAKEERERRQREEAAAKAEEDRVSLERARQAQEQALQQHARSQSSLAAANAHPTAEVADSSGARDSEVPVIPYARPSSGDVSHRQAPRVPAIAPAPAPAPAPLHGTAYPAYPAASLYPSSSSSPSYPRPRVRVKATINPVATGAPIPAVAPAPAPVMAGAAAESEEDELQRALRESMDPKYLPASLRTAGQTGPSSNTNGAAVTTAQAWDPQPRIVRVKSNPIRAKSNWRKKVDKRGRTYYKNVLANMTQWERPADYVDEDDVSQNAPASFLNERDGFSFSYTPTNSNTRDLTGISGVAPPSYASIQAQRHLGGGSVPAVGAPMNANVVVRPRPSPRAPAPAFPVTKRQQPNPTLSTEYAQSAYPTLDHIRPSRAQPMPQTQPVHAATTTHTVGNRATPGVWKKAFDKKSGRVYYKNRATKKTQWDRPPDFVDSPHSVSKNPRVASPVASIPAAGVGGCAQLQPGDIRVEGIVHRSASVPAGYKGVPLIMPHVSVATAGQSFRQKAIDGQWYFAVVPPGTKGGDLVKALVKV